MKTKRHPYILFIICMSFLAIRLQACQDKSNSMNKSDCIMQANEELAAVNMPDDPGYYEIVNATIFCNGFNHSRTYKAFVISIVDAKTQNASIQFEDEANTKQQLPHAFCDTLAHYLYRFYVEKEPIILSKKETNIMAEQIIPELKVKFFYKNLMYKDERWICKYDDGYIIEYSPSFEVFCDWIRYLCDQYYYNHNTPHNAYW